MNISDTATRTTNVITIWQPKFNCGLQCPTWPIDPISKHLLATKN